MTRAELVLADVCLCACFAGVGINTHGHPTDKNCTQNQANGKLLLKCTGYEF